MDAVVEATRSGTVTVIGGQGDDMTTTGDDLQKLQERFIAIQVCNHRMLNLTLRRNPFNCARRKQKLVVRNGGGDTAAACKKYGTEDKALEQKRTATVC